MKILILGGNGMLGHTLLQQYALRHDVKATLRGSLDAYRQWPLFTPGNSLPGIDLRDANRLHGVLSTFRPDVVVNCAGIIKQQTKAEIGDSLDINAWLPHRIADLCHTIGTRLIHISTDCVFSGRKGRYAETDAPDADDVYGRTKFLGEPRGGHCLTLRTSFVGRELASQYGLLEWFLAQRDHVRGFSRAIFSGLTAPELADIIEMIATEHRDASGLFHVGAERIDKNALLHLFRDHFKKDIEIAEDPSVEIDRSLDSSLFRKAFGYTPPSWAQMVQRL